MALIDDVHQLQAVYGTGREDTRATCNDTDNGFSLLVKWNLLANGAHTLRALADGVEFARVSFTVSNLVEPEKRQKRRVGGGYSSNRMG